MSDVVLNKQFILFSSYLINFYDLSSLYVYKIMAIENIDG